MVFVVCCRWRLFMLAVCCLLLSVVDGFARCCWLWFVACSGLLFVGVFVVRLLLVDECSVVGRRRLLVMVVVADGCRLLLLVRFVVAVCLVLLLLSTYVFVNWLCCLFFFCCWRWLLFLLMMIAVGVVAVCSCGLVLFCAVVL